MTGLDGPDRAALAEGRRRSSSLPVAGDAARASAIAIRQRGAVRAPLLRQFAGRSLERVPDETTILNFRRLLEKHELVVGILAVINGYPGERGLSLV